MNQNETVISENQPLTTELNVYSYDQGNIGSNVRQGWYNV